MQAVTVAGRQIHIAEAGDRSGLPLVFANSLGTDLRVWDLILPHLPAGLRLIRYDKRGHGLSDAGAGAFSIADLADDLAGILDTLAVRQAVICGLSVGGMIAQSLAARRPDLVRGLILCATAAKIGTAAMWDERIRAVEAGGIAALSGPVLERWFSARFRAEAPSLALWRNMLERTPADAYAATCAAIREADLTESTRALDLPVLAIAGEEDGSTPPDLVRATADLVPGARFALIRGAGHLPCVEAPAATARQIADFLKETRHA
ncbi:3-oxoadipate enol-lactonase [soil metagenome]